MLNPNEITFNALEYIFSTLNNYKKVEKVIIESRAEYVTDEVLSFLKQSIAVLIASSTASLSVRKQGLKLTYASAL